MRARLALAYSNIRCEVREISLKAKPEEMLSLSPKGTVPVLHIKNNNLILEQSLDIMLWALKINKQQKWLPNAPSSQKFIFDWINKNDNEFKPILDKYKYASRFPETSQEQYFDQAGHFLKQLEQHFKHNRNLGGDEANLADMAILPFIRQFASVNRPLFDKSFPGLVSWLNRFLNSPLFKEIMTKYPIWTPQDKTVCFSSSSYI